MRRRLSIRATAVSVALLIAAALPAGASVSAAGSPASNGSGSSSGAAAAAPNQSSSIGAGHKLTKESAGRRGTANVRSLARQAPTKRPSAQLPSLGRGTAGETTAPSGVVGSLADAAPLPTQATTNTDGPAAQTGFDGLTKATGPSTNVEPPDPWVAVGPDHVVQVVNLQMRITDRQGGNAIDTPLPDFFFLPTDIDTFDSDGRVIYDSLHGRWLATEVSWDCDTSAGASFGTGYVDFAVSVTADPTGDWDVYFFSYPDQLPDFPAPGTSTDKVGFASNLYDMAAGTTCVSNATFKAGHISVIDWSDLTNGGNVTGAGGDLPVFTPRFAVQAPATSSTLHAVGVALATDGVQYVSVTGTVAAGTVAGARFDDLTTLGLVDQFRDLLLALPQQPGPDTVTTAIDLRPTDAIWEGNRLAFVSNYPCTPTGDSTNRTCVRVTELDTSIGTAPPTLKQDFLVAENGKDSYMGGIGLSGNGTLHVSWTRSSTTALDYPSSYTAHQTLGAALNSLSAKELLGAGTGVYTGNRWGDYVGVAQDPQVPNQVWDGNQWSAGANWATTITPLRPAGTTYHAITPARVLDTRLGVGLTGMFVASVARTWQVAGMGGVPANAVAVTGNVTVTQQQAAGYLAVTPTATNTPPASTINFPLGDNRANNLTVPLSATGSLSAVYRGAAAGKKTHLIFDVTGYFVADDSGATFSAISPVRVLDTRIDSGLSGAFVSNTARQLQVTGGSIPSTATAITGNLTVTQQTDRGYLSVSPDPPAPLPATSTLNFPVKDNRANGLFAPLDGSGRLWIVYKSSTGATTHVILDVTGYFEPGTAGLRFVPLNPGRIMDTRTIAVLSGLAGPFSANTARILAVDGHWGVPLGTTAITGNLTVTQQTGPGYISVSPTAPPPVPLTSTLNFPFGDNRANGLVAPLNGSGDTYLVYVGAAGKTTHLILDLSGYFE